jgi:hypothetical protein
MEAYSKQMRDSIKVSVWSGGEYIPSTEQADYSENKPLMMVVDGKEIEYGVATTITRNGSYTPKVETKGEEVIYKDRVGWAGRKVDAYKKGDERLVVMWSTGGGTNVPYHFLSRREDGVLVLNETSVVVS